MTVWRSSLGRSKTAWPSPRRSTECLSKRTRVFFRGARRSADLRNRLGLFLSVSRSQPVKQTTWGHDASSQTLTISAGEAVSGVDQLTMM